MNSYLDIVERVLTTGQKKETRAGDTISVPNVFWTHDASKGFPLLTVRKMPIRSIAIEVEGFIKGITTKKWYQDRGCKFWDEWANPLAVEREGCTPAECDDLGPLGYSYQMRRFGEVYDEDDGGLLQGVDQLKQLVTTLKTNPNDRRMVVSLWNPPQLSRMALPPCTTMWGINVTNGKLHFSWFQRSADVARGLSCDIASQAILMKLLARESGLKLGEISCLIMDCHIYKQDIYSLKELLNRQPRRLPEIKVPKFEDIFEWDHTQLELLHYDPLPSMKFGPLAV